jgi:hypothetical protein
MIARLRSFELERYGETFDPSWLEGTDQRDLLDWFQWASLNGCPLTASCIRAMIIARSEAVHSKLRRIRLIVKDEIAEDAVAAGF